jgi:SAM-dependent methyltransferase
MMTRPYMYFGNVFENSAHYRSGLFQGLALHPKTDRDLRHDATDPLPFEDQSIGGFQSQDVFEHLEYTSVVGVLDEIHRCLKPGGRFRLSLPDYNSPVLKSRSVYDSAGNVLCDLAMGGRVAARIGSAVEVAFLPGGDSHLWFPTYARLLELIIRSNIRKSAQISIHHAWLDAKSYVCLPFEQGDMPVSRVPPLDMRAEGKPISIVVDFLK